MAKRKGIGKKLRFDVFKRDKFTCQYCGMKAPDVILAIDHVHPVSKGGTNELLNLLTSCTACNSGKSSALLSDDSAVEKQRKQMELLQERREQLDMMIQWQQGLRDILDSQVDHIDSMLSQRGRSLTEQGRKTVKSALRKYGLEQLMESFEVAMEQYDANFVDMAVKIAACRQKELEDPDRARILHIVNILNLRCAGLNKRKAVDTLLDARDRGVGMEVFESMLRLRGSSIKYALESIRERDETGY